MVEGLAKEAFTLLTLAGYETSNVEYNRILQTRGYLNTSTVDHLKKVDGTACVHMGRSKQSMDPQHEALTIQAAKWQLSRFWNQLKHMLVKGMSHSGNTWH